MRIARTMRLAWNMNAAAKSRIVRGVVGLLLLFTLVDIASPPCCCESAKLLSAARDNSARFVAETADHETSFPVSSRSGSEQSPDRNYCDEDCCLFCAHMLPVKALSADFVLNLSSSSLALNEALIPSPSLDATYHPPRFL